MQRFNNILVAIDASIADSPVLECAVQLATAHGARLKVVDVVPEFGWAQRVLFSGSEHLHQLLERERQQLLDARVGGVADRGLALTSKVLRGRTSTALMQEAAEGQHDLVVRSAKGATSRRTGAFGTTSYELLRRCPTAVLLVQAGSLPVGCRRVAAAVDANPEEPEVGPLNARILEAAVAMRDLTHASLDIVHVWSIYGERMVKEYMRTSEFIELEQTVRQEHLSLLEKLLAEAHVTVASESLHMIRGEPTIEIPNFVREQKIDLLVMGTVGRQGMAGLLLGNTAEMILSQLPCSVLAVKNPAIAIPVVASEPSVLAFPPEMPPVP